MNPELPASQMPAAENLSDRVTGIAQLVRWMLDLRTQDPARERAPIVNCPQCGSLTRTVPCGVCVFAARTNQ